MHNNVQGHRNVKVWCVSRLMMPVVEIKTAFWAVPHYDSTVNSQMSLALKLLVGNNASWKMLLQAVQAMCNVYCCSWICNSGFG